MDKITRLTPEQRSNLVAYLDGELADEEAQEIERILAGSPVARNEVEMLQRTWDLLDGLPRVHVSEEFTRKTLTSLKVDEIRPAVAERPWFQQFGDGGISADQPVDSQGVGTAGGRVADHREPRSVQRDRRDRIPARTAPQRPD
jgi:anti-sigma factor RsiW